MDQKDISIEDFQMYQRASCRSSIQKTSMSQLSYGRNRWVVRRRASKQQHNNRKTIEKCKSEPCIRGINGNDDDRRNLATSMEVLFGLRTYSDIFLSPDYMDVPSPQNSPGYNKDAKVVVNVTVEGTPGPIRTMVKLGSSVDETIRLVLTKYKEERRYPHLDQTASSSFMLYTSKFSLKSLSNSDVIGDVGSRNFHLRKSSRYNSREGQLTAMEVPGFCLKINKIIRRTSKLLKLFLGCLHCFG